MPPENTSIQLLEPDTFQSIISTAPSILEQNRASIAKAAEAGQTLLDTIEAAGGLNEELDQTCNDYQVKIRKTYEALQARRKPITQILDEIKKHFTGLEAQIDPKNPESHFSRIQTYRNEFAEQKLADQRRREAEARRKIEVEKERAEIRSRADVAISSALNAYLASRLQELSDLFNKVTLANFEQFTKLIYDFPSEFPPQQINSVRLELPAVYLSLGQVSEIVDNARHAWLNQFSAQYSSAIVEHQQSLSNRLISRRAELQQIAEAEKKNKAEAERLKAEAAERERLDRERLAAESRQRDEAAAREAEAARQAATMQTLFDAAAQVPANPDNVKEAYEISCLNPAAYLLLAQFWFEHGGISESVDKIERKTFGQMKAFAEKYATATGEFINSQLLEYKVAAKATVKR